MIIIYKPQKCIDPIPGMSESTVIRDSCVTELHKELLEKIGWIVIARARGLEYMVIDYKKSINDLIVLIKKELENIPYNNDLYILLIQAKYLKMRYRWIFRDFSMVF